MKDDDVCYFLVCEIASVKQMIFGSDPNWNRRRMGSDGKLGCADRIFHENFSRLAFTRTVMGFAAE